MRVVVTGAARGIGAAIAERFAVAGHAVCLVGRDLDALQARVAQLSSQGHAAVAAACDVTRWGDVELAISEVEEVLGGIDVLVNNAGGWLGDPVEKVDVERVTALVSTTVLGTIYWSKAVIPAMLKAGSGFILNVGSTSGLPSSRDSATASAPKAAVASFSQGLAREVAPHGIRVAVIHPAKVRKGVPRETAESRIDGVFRTISPEQVADAALWIVEQSPNVLVSELVLGPAGSPP
jgi:NADP-dependent 3-hydroxy acid dehydrogenase YdfG